MKIHHESFLADFASMSRNGATPGGGVDRQAATTADGQNRNWFRGLVEGHGFSVHYDNVGNQFSLLELSPGAPWIAVGSHLDSQPLAGRFDGAYGVLAGAHAALRVRETIQDNESAKFNIVVVNWFNEEGCRFKPSMMGSAVFTGKLPAPQVLATTDPHGVSVREALESIGTIGDFEIEVAASVEIHIEQGDALYGRPGARHRPGRIDLGCKQVRVHSSWGASAYRSYRHCRPTRCLAWCQRARRRCARGRFGTFHR